MRVAIKEAVKKWPCLGLDVNVRDEPPGQREDAVDAAGALRNDGAVQRVRVAPG